MAKITSVLGTIKGKLGNIKGSKWKDRNVISQMPSGYTDAKTPAQQAQRRKFSALNKLGRQMAGIVKRGFASFRSSMTWLNAFIKNNQAAVSDNGTTAVIDQLQLSVSSGSLGGVSGMNLQNPIGGDTIATVAWTPNGNGSTAFNTDEFRAVVLDSSDTVIGVLEGNDPRSGGLAQVNLDRALQTGEVITVLGFFEAADGSSVSDTSANQGTVA